MQSSEVPNRHETSCCLKNHRDTVMFVTHRTKTDGKLYRFVRAGNNNTMSAVILRNGQWCCSVILIRFVRVPVKIVYYRSNSCLKDKWESERGSNHVKNNK